MHYIISTWPEMFQKNMGALSKVEVPYTDISGFEFEMQIAHISPFLPVSGKTTQK